MLAIHAILVKSLLFQCSGSDRPDLALSTHNQSRSNFTLYTIFSFLITCTVKYFASSDMSQAHTERHELIQLSLIHYNVSILLLSR